MNLLKRKQDYASANVVDGTLILSCPHAVTPVVWQMDLADVKAAALEVVHDAEANEFALSLKNPKESNPIEAARFDSREGAVEALMAVSAALENAQGHLGTGPASGPAPAAPAAIPAAKKKRVWRWAMVALSLLVLLVIFGIWSSVAMRGPQSFVQEPLRTSNNGGGGQQSGATAPANSAGAPVSADDFLRGL